ncbi:MAG: aminoacetone oxidase family FAD-binding enzyme [Candidatus Taylorbacteria bacterium]|nr:aminoacetone oxidase family FAD-binding enzyme [Candidatus Taylorbacteria bacterium]
MKVPKKARYDVAVIGGGPAGMMAAGRAAELGASVVLVEKNEGLGKKLLITGGGRCNVTNDKPDPREFLEKLGKKGKFLFSTFAQHSVKDSLDFFNSRGMGTKVENEGRVFPVTDSARTVYDLLVRYMKEGGVEVVTGLAAKGFHARDGVIVGLNTEKDTVVADSYILATGGTSAPETGSTGEAFKWLARIGHNVTEPDAALVPVKIAEKWVRDLSGVSHQHVKLALVINGKRDTSRIGRMVFAHFGLSGPLVLNFSKEIREAMQYAQTGDKIELALDIMPDLDSAALDKRVQEAFATASNKKLKNSLKGVVVPALVATVLSLAKLDGEKEANAVTREERLALVKTLKDMRMTPTGFLGKEKAIVASGGVKLEEVDFRTMASRLFPNLYLIGDVLDVERPSGGYSLQLCWTTGWVAGKSAAKRSKENPSSRQA